MSLLAVQQKETPSKLLQEDDKLSVMRQCNGSGYKGGSHKEDVGFDTFGHQRRIADT
jgi:hypothetical protein